MIKYFLDDKIWLDKKEKIKERIKLINNILDIYDGHHPLTYDKVILDSKDVRNSNRVLDRMKCETS